MLIDAIHHAREAGGNIRTLWGQKKNLTTSAVARMNLFLRGGTLRKPGFHI